MRNDSGVELLRRSPVVHAPELECAPPPSFEVDDHVQLLPILRAEVVFGDFPSTGNLPLDDEIISLPAAFYLDIPAPLDFLGDLPAVAVE